MVTIKSQKEIEKMKEACRITALVYDEIEKYICGIFNNKNQKVISIYANPDHILIFFSYKNLTISILNVA